MDEETEAQEDLSSAPGLLLPYLRCARRRRAEKVQQRSWKAGLTFRVSL